MTIQWHILEWGCAVKNYKFLFSSGNAPVLWNIADYCYPGLDIRGENQLHLIFFFTTSVLRVLQSNVHLETFCLQVNVVSIIRDLAAALPALSS